MKKNWKWEFSFELRGNNLFYKFWFLLLAISMTILSVMLFYILDYFPTIPLLFGIFVSAFWIWVVRILLSNKPTQAISQSFLALRGAIRLLSGKEDEKIWVIRQIVEENNDAQLRLIRGNHGHLKSAEIILRIHPDHPDYPG